MGRLTEAIAFFKSPNDPTFEHSEDSIFYGMAFVKTEQRETPLCHLQVTMEDLKLRSIYRSSLGFRKKRISLGWHQQQLKLQQRKNLK